jgi:hypothetical protein
MNNPGYWNRAEATPAAAAPTIGIVDIFGKTGKSYPKGKRFQKETDEERKA